ARYELISDPQGFEHLLRRREDAGEDRCLPLGVSARLARTEFHDEVEELKRIVGLEREDKFLIIEAERIRSVDLDRRISVSDAERVAHDTLALYARAR